MELGQLVSNENQEIRFKTFSTLKMLYTGCSTKGAILLLSLRVENASYELRVTSSNIRVTSSNPRVTRSNPRVTSLNSRVASSNPRVRRLKARVH